MRVSRIGCLASIVILVVFVGHLYRGLELDRLIGYNADDCQSYADNNRCPGPVLH
jgi:hypothetical protein